MGIRRNSAVDMVIFNWDRLNYSHTGPAVTVINYPVAFSCMIIRRRMLLQLITSVCQRGPRYG